MALVQPQNALLGIISMVRHANLMRQINVQPMVQHQPSIAILQTMLPLVHVRQVVSAKLQNAKRDIIFQALLQVTSVLKTR